MAESVKVGDKFPVSELVASDGQRLDLGALAGPAVVYFYPADNTDGCTLQAIEFNRAFDDYAAANVALVGVSVDDDESHRCFAADHSLRFPLVADPERELILVKGSIPGPRGGVVILRDAVKAPRKEAG